MMCIVAECTRMPRRQAVVGIFKKICKRSALPFHSVASPVLNTAGEHRRCVEVCPARSPNTKTPLTGSYWSVSEVRTCFLRCALLLRVGFSVEQNSAKLPQLAR